MARHLSVHLSDPVEGPSQHRGLGLQDGLGSGGAVKLNHVLAAVLGAKRAV